MDTQSKVDWLKLLLGIVLVAAILYVGKSLFIPLSFALLISFILYPICRWLEMKKVPRWGAIGLCLFLLLSVVGLLGWLLVRQMMRFTKEWPGVEAKLILTWEKLSEHLEHAYNIDTDRQKEWLQGLASDAASSAFNMVQGVVYTSTVGLVLLLLIPVYVALILYYREQLVHGLFLLFRKDEQKKIRLILQETIITYYNFIKGMAIVYLIVAVLNSIGLLLLGIPHAIFFGVVASILTFIPYVGITLGAILPMAIAWVTYDTIWYPIGVIIVFGIVQYLEANLIFPWAVSYRLRVNMLFTLLAIVAGGILWGASGMILFIPFLAILKLIADKHEQMRPISVLLGNGKD
ncbi:AI-2E family transporter [Pontibacter sp. H249]|uniref:AI-2E family transporter n=1 Tax=Pontibacter sp. H249 TaxID=3133420 RepID=UPI0030C294C7